MMKHTIATHITSIQILQTETQPVSTCRSLQHIDSVAESNAVILGKAVQEAAMLVVAEPEAAQIHEYLCMESVVPTQRDRVPLIPGAQYRTDLSEITVNQLVVHSHRGKRQ